MSLHRYAIATATAAIALLTSSGAIAADTLAAGDFRALERLIAGREGEYARCTELPCPDVDCTGWGASVDALNRLKALLGSPMREAPEQNYGDFETRRRTLGYWTEQEDKAGRKLYEDILNQANRNRTKQADAEFWAEWQKTAINVSKLAQAVADFRSLADVMQKSPLKSGQFTGLQEAMAASEILNSGATIVELGEVIRERLVSRGLAPPEKSPTGAVDTMHKVMSYTALAQQSFASVGNLAQGRDAAELAKAQYLRMLELRSAPVVRGQLTEAAALAARRDELAALKKAADANMAQAGQMARNAANAGLLAAVKLATIYAEGLQEDMRKQIDDYRTNASAEEKTLADQAAGLENGADRVSAMLALRGRVNSALSLLSACQKSCGIRLPASPRAVPVGQFVLPQSAEANAGKESYGSALAWFADAYRAQAAELAAAGSFRIEDGKIMLEGRPSSVGVKKPITIGFAGSQCLINRGQISGDGETRKLREGNDQVGFSGKEKAGDYTFQYAMADLWQEPGSERYKAETVVRVGRDKMLGYWRVMSPIKIRNGRGDLVEMQQAFSHIAIVADAQETHRLWFIRPGGASANPKPDLNHPYAARCQRDGARLSCRATTDLGCSGQWLEYQIEMAVEDQARLKASGGEISVEGPDGCVKFPHNFEPWDFSLTREPADSAMIKEHPCPEGHRCE